MKQRGLGGEKRGKKGGEKGSRGQASGENQERNITLGSPYH